MLKSLSSIFSKKNSSTILYKEELHRSSNSYFCSIGKPVWMDRNYGEFAREAYIKNVVAHRAINMIAHAAASVPLKLYQYVKDDRHPIAKHDLLDLLFRPNPTQNGKEFLESVYICRQISGNAYVLAITNQMLNDSDNVYNRHCQANLAYGCDIAQTSICELYNLRPDRVQVIAGGNFIPAGHRYTVGERHFDYMVDPVTNRSLVLHIKNFHPLSDWYGLSSIEAAAFSIDQHNQASAWNQALLQNGARPSGAIIVKNINGDRATLSDEQFYRLKTSINEVMCGPQSAGRPLVLEGGLEWQEMSMSPKDMDYIESKNNSAREIALALGVPPQLLGIPGDNTYSNLAEARIALWEQTILPLVENTVHHFNRWLVPYFGDDLELSYDIDCISALAQRADAIWGRMEKSSFMTVNEKRKVVGLGPIDGGDKLWQVSK